MQKAPKPLIKWKSAIPNINKQQISTFLIGSEDINARIAIRSLGNTNWPFGLLMSEQT